MGAGRAARRGRVAENEALHPAVPPTQTGAHPSQPVTTRSPLAPAPLSRCPHVGTLPVGWQRGPGTLGLVALPASSIWLSSKRFLLVGRPCGDWHRDCVSCWSRRQDREAGRMCVRDRLPAQPHGLCFDDHGAVVCGGARAKEVLKMSGRRWLILLLLVVGLSGCFLTKVATVPMRVGGAVVSVVPVVGDPASEAIDKAADAVDTLPF